MIDKLPYELTTGVTATREGLVITNNRLAYLALSDAFANGSEWERIIPWPDAAERLRYREGEPWCSIAMVGSGDCVVLRSADDDNNPNRFISLHRLAAILCDGTDEFRVLHWCIHNL